MGCAICLQERYATPYSVLRVRSKRKHKRKAIYTCHKHKQQGDIRSHCELKFWRQTFKSKIAEVHAAILKTRSLAGKDSLISLSLNKMVLSK